jgi:hypothetical protein
MNDSDSEDVAVQGGVMHLVIWLVYAEESLRP